MSKIHIANIDYPVFYATVFPSVDAARSFYKRLEDLPPEKNAAKIVFHQAARMVWLADQIDEVARGRPAFQVLFYLTSAELVAKITFDFKGEGDSKKHVHRFFTEICSDNTREKLAMAFSRLPYGEVTPTEVVNLLYDIRCDVVHRGMYYGFQLAMPGDDFSQLTHTNGISFTTNLTIPELRHMVLEGAVLASKRLLKEAHDSEQLETK